MSLGWSAEYVEVSLEKLSYGQLLNLISTPVEPFFINMYSSYFF